MEATVVSVGETPWWKTAYYCSAERQICARFKGSFCWNRLSSWWERQWENVGVSESSCISNQPFSLTNSPVLIKPVNLFVWQEATVIPTSCGKKLKVSSHETEANYLVFRGIISFDHVKASIFFYSFLFSFCYLFMHTQRRIYIFIQLLLCTYICIVYIYIKCVCIYIMYIYSVYTHTYRKNIYIHISWQLWKLPLGYESQARYNVACSMCGIFS